MTAAEFKTRVEGCKQAAAEAMAAAKEDSDNSLRDAQEDAARPMVEAAYDLWEAEGDSDDIDGTHWEDWIQETIMGR